MSQRKSMKSNSLVATNPRNLPEQTAAELPSRNVVFNAIRHQSEDEAHLKEFLFSLRKYWLLVVGVPLLITALVAVYMFREPSIYESMAGVQVALEKSSPTLGTTTGGTYVVNPGKAPDFRNSHPQLQ